MISFSLGHIIADSLDVLKYVFICNVLELTDVIIDCKLQYICSALSKTNHNLIIYSWPPDLSDKTEMWIKPVFDSLTPSAVEWTFMLFF